MTFSQPMNPARAQALTSYILVLEGPDHQFGTRSIRLGSVQYNPASHSVTLQPVHRLPLHAIYQLTIVGTAPNGPASESATLLDGAKTGQPGSNAVIRIDDKLLTPPIVHRKRKANLT